LTPANEKKKSRPQFPLTAVIVTGLVSFAAGVFFMILGEWWVSQNNRERLHPAPDCPGCLATAPIQFPHSHLSFRLVMDPNRNDNVTKWTDCIDEITRCEKRKPLADCVTNASACTQECKDAYRQAISRSDEEQALRDVFFRESSPCYPSPEA